ncbi:hypothetical protein D3C72_931730 [compost metagenome]
MIIGILKESSQKGSMAAVQLLSGTKEPTNLLRAILRMFRNRKKNFYINCILVS